MDLVIQADPSFPIDPSKFPVKNKTAPFPFVNASIDETFKTL